MRLNRWTLVAVGLGLALWAAFVVLVGGTK